MWGSGFWVPGAQVSAKVAVKEPLCKPVSRAHPPVDPHSCRTRIPVFWLELARDPLGSCPQRGSLLLQDQRENLVFQIFCQKEPIPLTSHLSGQDPTTTVSLYFH